VAMCIQANSAQRCAASALSGIGTGAVSTDFARFGARTRDIRPGRPPTGGGHTTYVLLDDYLDAGMTITIATNAGGSASATSS
jgi:hypothetical protein